MVGQCWAFVGLKSKARSRCAQLRHETVRQASCVASCVKCFGLLHSCRLQKGLITQQAMLMHPPNHQDWILANRKCKQLPSHVSDATSTIHFSLGEASWVRDQILRRQFLQQQLQCRSRSTCGKETDWRPAIQQRATIKVPILTDRH